MKDNVLKNIEESGFGKLTQDEDGFIDDKGTFWETPDDYVFSSILGFCGCGNPDEVAGYVIKMFEQLDKQEWENYDNLPYMFFVYWANNKEFAEHGCTARCSWLTEKGTKLLEILKVLNHK